MVYGAIIDPFLCRGESPQSLPTPINSLRNNPAELGTFSCVLTKPTSLLSLPSEERRGVSGGHKSGLKRPISSRSDLREDREKEGNSGQGIQPTFPHLVLKT